MIDEYILCQIRDMPSYQLYELIKIIVDELKERDQ